MTYRVNRIMFRDRNQSSIAKMQILNNSPERRQNKSAGTLSEITLVTKEEKLRNLLLPIFNQSA